MSRAINLTLSETDVRSRCHDNDVLISAIEALPSGGTHLVCMTSEGAEEFRQKYGTHIILGPVRRFAFYRA